MWRQTREHEVARKTVRARRLGQQLRKLREAQRMSQGQLCELLNDGQEKSSALSQGQLSKIEAGSARLDAHQFQRMIAALGADGETESRLEGYRARAEEPGWWEDFSPYLHETLEWMIELGEDATTLLTYDSTFVQGLMQSEEYARTVVESARAWVRPTAVDDLVELRMRRQQRLSEPDFRGLTAVLSEAVLHHQVGGRRVMAGQLDKLCAIAEEGHHGLHVLPYSAAPWPGVGAFVIFGFPEDDDSDAVQIDGDLGAAIFEDKESIKSMTYTHNAALAQALSARETLDKLHEEKKKLDQ